MILEVESSVILKVRKVETPWDFQYKNKATGDLSLYQKMMKLQTSSVTVSGFGSGGYIAANLLAMFNENLDGGAIISGGGPCATKGNCFDNSNNVT